MKTFPQNTARTFCHPKLEISIMQEHAKFKKEAGSAAKLFAQKDLPALEGDVLDPYISGIVGKYEQQKTIATKEIQASVHKASGVMELDAWKDADADLQAQVETQQKKADALQYECDTLDSTYNWKHFPLIWLLIVSGSALEAFFSRGSFQLFGENLGLSYLIAFLFGGLMALLSHLVPKYIQKGQTPEEQKARTWTVALVMTLFFAFLASLRVLFFNKTGQLQSDLLLVGISFVFINLVLFAASCYLAYYYLPTKEDTKAKEKLDELTKTHKEIDALKGTQQQAKQDRNAILTDRMARMEYAKYIEKWIESLKRDSIEEFKMVNIHQRGKIPSCFKQPFNSTNDNPIV